MCDCKESCCCKYKIVKWYVRDVEHGKVRGFYSFEEMLAWVNARANEY